MKKRVAVLISLLSLSMMTMSVSADDAELTPGVTVFADEDSATGYTAQFVYEDAEAESVEIVAGFAFYYDDEETRGSDPEEFYTPEEWEDGMFAAEVNRYVAPLEKVDGTDYWTISIPLPSGHYQYLYTVDGAEESILDPANLPLQADVEGGGIYEASTVDIPYDEEKQADSVDYSFAMEREDGQTGEVTFVTYEDVDGEERPLGVYLPYGYDEESEEPYKVLYLSHGGGGNETHWFAGTNANYIFDNLIAEEKVEPTVIVCMNNTVYEWDYDKISSNVMDAIIPFVEENYNVGTETADRAFAGQSMGGMTTSNIFYRHAADFGYFGIWSGGDSSIDPADFDTEAWTAPTVMLGLGIYDFAYLTDEQIEEQGRSEFFNTFVVPNFRPILDDAGVEYDFYEINGAHDWYIWQQLLRMFAEDYLWK